MSNEINNLLKYVSETLTGFGTQRDATTILEYVFNGNQRDRDFAVKISARGVQWVVRQARKNSGIKKQVTTHTLRHTFATHLLEMGLDLVSIKEQLGHASVQTTMIYLQVAQLDRTRAFSPLDKLYQKQCK